MSAVFGFPAIRSPFSFCRSWPTAQLIILVRSAALAAPSNPWVMAVLASLKLVRDVQEAKVGEQVFTVRPASLRKR
ncbi:hypothetical protein D3C84_1258100 [compost metagenome]